MVTLLHLSDIHFNEDDVNTAMDPNFHLRHTLLEDVRKMRAKLGVSPDIIVVSGDIAYHGSSPEFSFAANWFEELCQAAHATLDRIFVVPGNHDVVRKIAAKPVVLALHKQIKEAPALTIDATIRGLLADPDAGEYLYESLRNYNAFASQFFCDLTPPEGTIARRNLRVNDGSRLRILGLNSTFVSSEADRKGNLFVDPAAMQLTNERGTVNLVVWHHGFTWLRNGDTLSDHLNSISSLQLFGHEHTVRIDLNRDWVRVGASAMHPDKSEGNWSPGYNWIQLKVDGAPTQRKLLAQIHVRVWQPNPPLFQPLRDRYDEDIFVHSVPLEPWISSEAPPTLGDQPLSPEPAILADHMDSLRSLSIRFYRLSLSQKAEIAGS